MRPLPDEAPFPDAGMLRQQIRQTILRHRIPALRWSAERSNLPDALVAERQDGRAGAQHLRRSRSETNGEFSGSQRWIQLKRCGGELRQQALEGARETGGFFSTSFECTHEGLGALRAFRLYKKRRYGVISI